MAAGLKVPPSHALHRVSGKHLLAHTSPSKSVPRQTLCVYGFDSYTSLAGQLRWQRLMGCSQAATLMVAQCGTPPLT